MVRDVTRVGHVLKQMPCDDGQRIARSMDLWKAGQLGKSMRLAAWTAESLRTSCANTCLPEARLWYATLLIRIRALGAAERVLAESSFQLRGAENTRLRAAFLLCQAEIELANGDLDAAVAAAEQGLRLAKHSGNHELVPTGNVVLAVIATRRMDATAGLTYANQLRDYALIGNGNSIPGQSAWAVLQALEAREGAANIADLIGDVIDRDVLADDLLTSQPAAAPWLVRITLALNDEKSAIQVVNRMTMLAGRNRTFRSIQAAAVHASGLFHRDADASEKATSMHLDRWSQASALEDATDVQCRTLEPDLRVERLKRAADIYRSVGANRDNSRVRMKLREIEKPTGHIPDTRAPAEAKTGQLTETELSVAELVSQGLTNRRVGQRLFMSPHTVAFHLKKIYRKVDVSSRVELARSWDRHVADPTSACNHGDR